MEVINSQKKSRKFRDIENFDLNESNQYFLLPFRFHRVTAEKEIIVNEVGDYLILPNGTFERIVKRQINKEIDAELYGDLIANFFISEKVIPPLIDVLATRYRTKKTFLKLLYWSSYFRYFSKVRTYLSLLSSISRYSK